MADSGLQAFDASPEMLSGPAIPFRFEITWHSLSRPLRPSPTDPTTPSETAPHVDALSLIKPAAEVEAREWEMVLPRMKRPAALRREPPRESPAPRFATSPELALPRRLSAVAMAGVLVALGAAAYQWLWPESAAPTAASGIEMGGAGWISEWASDAAGSSRGRQLSLYRPSISMSDYDLEFLGRIERRSLGWVFRAADSSNYYAAKLESAEAGTSRLVITRFAVINGVEGPHIQRPIALTPGPGEMLKVKLEARGPRFTIWIATRLAEDWEDGQLKRGGLGFLNERGELGQIGSIQISFPKGGARR
jgi:hypothetical protein